MPIRRGPKMGIISSHSTAVDRAKKMDASLRSAPSSLALRSDAYTTGNVEGEERGGRVLHLCACANT